MKTMNKKKLSTSILAGSAFALGSFALTAAPAMAVPSDEVQQILSEVDVIVVVADVDTTQYYPDGDVQENIILAGDRIQAVDYEDGQLIDVDGVRYDAADFSHVSASVYEEFDVDVPAFIADSDISDGETTTDTDDSANGNADAELEEEFEEEADVDIDVDEDVVIEDDGDVIVDDDEDVEEITFEERDEGEGEPTEITAGIVPGGDYNNPAGLAIMGVGALALAGGGIALSRRKKAATATVSDNS